MSKLYDLISRTKPLFPPPPKKKKKETDFLGFFLELYYLGMFGVNHSSH